MPGADAEPRREDVALPQPPPLPPVSERAMSASAALTMPLEVAASPAGSPASVGWLAARLSRSMTLVRRRPLGWGIPGGAPGAVAPPTEGDPLGAMGGLGGAEPDTEAARVKSV